MKYRTLYYVVGCIVVLFLLAIFYYAFNVIKVFHPGICPCCPCHGINAYGNKFGGLTIMTGGIVIAYTNIAIEYTPFIVLNQGSYR